MGDPIVKNLLSLANELGLGGKDYVIVADGAGGTTADSCGWYATILHVESGVIIDSQGGLSHGTNNVAELAPFLFGLWLIQSYSDVKVTASVGCISDSEVTVRCGNGQYERKANGCLWTGIEWFEKRGYDLSWVHVPRNSNPFNVYSDVKAKGLRKLMKSMETTSII